MAALEATASEDSKATILAILDENRIMSLATVRADGWPQVTMVGYAHDDLTLFCTVGRSSQKLANISRNPRVSIAIGQDQPKGPGLPRLVKVASETFVRPVDADRADEVMRDGGARPVRGL